MLISRSEVRGNPCFSCASLIFLSAKKLLGSDFNLALQSTRLGSAAGWNVSHLEQKVLGSMEVHDLADQTGEALSHGLGCARPPQVQPHLKTIPYVPSLTMLTRWNRSTLRQELSMLISERAEPLGESHPCTHE